MTWKCDSNIKIKVIKTDLYNFEQYKEGDESEIQET